MAAGQKEGGPRGSQCFWTQTAGVRGDCSGGLGPGPQVCRLGEDIWLSVFGLKAVGSCLRVTHWRVVSIDLHCKDHSGSCVDGLCQVLSQDGEGWEIPVCSTPPLHETLPLTCSGQQQPRSFTSRLGSCNLYLTSSVPPSRHRKSCHLELFS